MKKGFTLIELLIVMGILTILVTTVILVINPVEYTRQSRDAQRIGDTKTIDDAISTGLANNPNITVGSAQTVYVSLPDAATNCPSLTPTLPTLPVGWSYYCSSAANYRKTNGTGWIPVNFNAFTAKSPLTVLPVDPINDASKGLFYAYVPNAGITTVLESIKVRNDAGAKDGGMDAYRYEQGKDLTGLPTISLATVPAIDPSTVKVLIVEYQECGQNLPAQLASLGFTNVVTDTTITTEAQVAAVKPSIVVASEGCWGVVKGSLLNQLYADGYAIYSEGNDTAASITPVASSVSTAVAAGTITPLAKHAINTGWASTGNSGADGRQGLTANAKAIVLARDNTLGYDEVIYLEEAAKGKWFHIQPSVPPNDVLLKNGLLYLAR